MSALVLLIDLMVRIRLFNHIPSCNKICRVTQKSFPNLLKSLAPIPHRH
jgi:hypothetical protein